MDSADLNRRLESSEPAYVRGFRDGMQLLAESQADVFQSAIAAVTSEDGTLEGPPLDRQRVADTILSLARASNSLAAELGAMLPEEES